MEGERKVTPDTLAKANTEHSHQRALFAWANMASNFGFDAAWDDRSYTVQGHAKATYPRPANSDPYPFGTPLIPELARLFAIPNGGQRDKITAGKLKAEGVKPGVPDIFLPVPRHVWAGLFVEMKRPKTTKAGARKAEIIDQAAGSTSDDQDGWIGYLRHAQYGVAVAFDWRSAATQIQSYMEWGMNADQRTA